MVLISPHNEAIRDEFNLGFREWYKAKTGRSVFLDWRNIGGTSDIARYLEGEYTASFRNLWTATPGHAWSAEIQSGFQNGRLAKDAPAVVREARAAFLASEAGCKIDLFFGGGPSDFAGQALAGRLVDSGLIALHPDWFTQEAFPRVFGGEENWDKDGLWFGAVLSSYGILFNRDSLKRLGFEREPEQWSDLCDPRFLGEVGLCDPTKSGSIAQAFQNVIQQQIYLRIASLKAADPSADPKALLADGVRMGWTDGLRLIQLAGANARYFTDTSQKPPIDVASGNCAAGMCIDFYGREQQEAVLRRGGGQRTGYALARGRIGVLGGPDRPPARSAAPRGRREVHGVRPLARGPEALGFPDGYPGRPEGLRASPPAGPQGLLRPRGLAAVSQRPRGEPLHREEGAHFPSGMDLAAVQRARVHRALDVRQRPRVDSGARAGRHRGPTLWWNHGHGARSSK